MLRNTRIALGIAVVLGVWAGLEPPDAVAQDVNLTGNLCAGSTSCTGTPPSDLTSHSLVPELLLFDDSPLSMWRFDAIGTPFHLHDDVTGTLPFVIQQGAPNNSFLISSTGRVGFGTSIPGGTLHIFGAATSDVFSGVGPDLVSGPALNFGYSGSSFGRGSGFFNVRPDASAVAPNPSIRFATVNVQRMIITNTGNVGIGTTTPANPLQMGSGAFVSAGGVWTDASSREVKQDIQPLTEDEARAALARLDPVKFAYKADPAERHVGFIAEDVPDLVATPDRKALSPMDIVAVLTRVVQEQQRMVDEQQRLVQEQQQAIAELTAEVAVLRGAAGGPSAARPE